MKRTYIAFLASLTLMSVFMVNFLPFQDEGAPILRNQTTILQYDEASTLQRAEDDVSSVVCDVHDNVIPEFDAVVHFESEDCEFDYVECFVPCSVACEPSIAESLISQQFAPAVDISVIAELPSTEPEPTAEKPASSSYIYFYTGVPVHPAPKAVFVYAGGATHTVPMSMTPPAPSMPVASPQLTGQVMRTHVVPVFIPQVAPSRFGAPRLIYSNGVVIKPTVYFPNQPVRNTIRGFTP